MDTNEAVEALSALAQPTRLSVFRRLVRAGLNGLPAGVIADAEGVPHNTMSSHLGILTRAGLITSRRQSRSIIYTANVKETGALLSFLVSDCCAGHPEICAPIIEIASGGGCCPAPAPPKRAKRKSAKRKSKS